MFLKPALRLFFYGGLFPAWYRLKFWILRPFLGYGARSAVLYDAYFPAIVLRQGGAKVGQDAVIGRFLTLWATTENSFTNLEIGDGVIINAHVFIDLSSRVVLKDRVGIGFNVSIFTHLDLGNSRLSVDYPREYKEVVVEEDSLVLPGACLIMGARLGAKSMVLNGTVVSGEVLPDSVVTGNPMRIVPSRRDLRKGDAG